MALSNLHHYRLSPLSSSLCCAALNHDLRQPPHQLSLPPPLPYVTLTPQRPRTPTLWRLHEVRNNEVLKPEREHTTKLHLTKAMFTSINLSAQNYSIISFLLLLFLFFLILFLLRLLLHHGCECAGCQDKVFHRRLFHTNSEAEEEG